MKYRKLTLAKSVLLATADRLMHGPVIRGFARFEAKRVSRCDDCGLDINIGDEGCVAYRPKLQPKLFVHETCPGGDVLFKLIPWLTKWEGADIVSAYFPAQGDQNCVRCPDKIYANEMIMLVRKPGPMNIGEKHSDWVHERCVKR